MRQILNYLRFLTVCKFTSIWTQCVQMKPMTRVPMLANTKPPFLNAIGIARIPVPSELFNKCMRDPIVLNNKNIMK